MTTFRWIRVMVVTTVLATTGAGLAHAELFFRGLPLYQQGNELSSPALSRPIPFGIDVRDEFDRTGPIRGSDADRLQIGFVPPFEGVPDGSLGGVAADQHGRWMSTTASGLEAQNGVVRRMISDGISMACVPWRVFSTLGDDYLIQMTANVAEGESVRLGYVGDVSQYGNLQGLASRLGQLVLGIERGSDADTDPTFNSSDLRWTVSWDVNGTRLSVQGEATAPRGEDLNLQLGWKDERSHGDDTFDAWLGTSAGNRRLARGNLGTNLSNAIEVFGAGFEMLGSATGTNDSWIGDFIGAVPEPASGTMSLIGLVTLVGMVRRRR